MARPARWGTFVRHAQEEILRMTIEASHHMPVFDDLCTCSRPLPCSALSAYRAEIAHYTAKVDAGPVAPTAASISATVAATGSQRFPSLWGALRRMA